MKQPRWTVTVTNDPEQMGVDVRMEHVPGATMKQAEQNALSILDRGMGWTVIEIECTENEHARLDLDSVGAGS